MKKLIIIVAVVVFSCSGAQAQRVSLKTNLLYDATSTVNLGAELGIGQRWTLDLSGNYNPWTFGDNRKMKHWLIQPEVRFWPCQKFNGHFFGFHTHYGAYNWGGMLPFGVSGGRIQNSRYDGWLAGAGLSYGYHWILSNHWGLEATIGAGYAYLKYDRFRCPRCGERLGAGERENYFGPTKVGITLVYIIK